MRVPEIVKKYENKKVSNISIVIPTFNQYEITRSTILKLKNQTIDFDIIVIDNHSSDNTFNRLKEDFPEITILLSKENYGGAGGLYLGQKYAYEKDYEYIILSDNDAIPIDDDLIEEIVKNSNENHIVDFINAAEETMPSLKIFHYGCYHRDIIKKVGYVDWRMFLYGDDVEYSLRLEKYSINRKKIYKRYWHPMKYHYQANRVYFEIRNELENAKRYNKRLLHTLNMLFSRLIFFLFYEKEKLYPYFKAIFDWLYGRWDNSIINKNLPTRSVNYKKESINDFIKHLNKNSTYCLINHPRLKKIFNLEHFNYSLWHCISLGRYSFIENLYTYPTILSKEFYYIVSIDEKQKEIVYFYKQNNILINLLKLSITILPILFILLLIYISIYLKRYIIGDNIISNNYRMPDYYRKIQYLNRKDRNNNTAVVILAYNQINMVKKISKYYEENSKIIDVIFVDNCSTDGTYEYLNKNYGDKFHIIKTDKNYGGAGGFAIGQEYAISLGYDYCILTEEDAIALDKDLLKEMLKKAGPGKIIKSKFYELGTPSFTLHFTLYPIDVFYNAGVMNADLFFRADDWEYGKRIEKLNYSEVIVDRYYSHPILKKGFSIGTQYFGFRNGLLVYSKRPRVFALYDVSIIFLKDLWYSIFALLNDKNTILIKEFIYSFYDYISNNIYNNHYRLKMFQGNILSPDNVKINNVRFEEFFNNICVYNTISSTLKYNYIVKKYIKYSKDINCYTLSSKYSGTSRNLAFFYKKIIFLEELDIVNKNLAYFEYSNKIYKSIPLLLVSASISIIIYFIAIPIIVFKIIQLKIQDD